MKIFNYLKSFNVVGIVLWLLLGVVIFFLIKYTSRLFKYIFPSENPLTPKTEQDKKEIADQSGDFMINGNYTYRSGAALLFHGMYGNNPLGWWKSTDHASIGNFMLTVKPSEYLLLSNVYALYKDEAGTWIIGSKICSLSDDLRDLFSSSEENKYLSHIKHLL